MHDPGTRAYVFCSLFFFISFSACSNQAAHSSTDVRRVGASIC